MSGMNKFSQIFGVYSLKSVFYIICWCCRMVSRRKILSRSRDDLTFDEEPTTSFQKKFEEDTFYSQEKLYKVRVYI